MLRFEITRQQKNVFDCFVCYKLNEIYKLFLPFIEPQNKYLTSNDANNR